MDMPILQETATDAIRYWERRRPIYNAVLAAVVVACLVVKYPASLVFFSSDNLLSAVAAAVVLNVAYCAAYVPDVFAQLSGFRESWRRVRWVVFAIGMTFASIIARFWTLAGFSK